MSSPPIRAGAGRLHARSMLYITGPERECFWCIDGVYVSPGAGAPVEVVAEALAALLDAEALVVLAGGEAWPECMTEAALAAAAGVPLVGEMDLYMRRPDLIGDPWDYFAA